MAATSDTYVVNYNLKMEVQETLDLDLDMITDPTVTHTSTAVNGTLNASSTPPISQVFAERKVIAAGDTYSLDLTAAVRANLPDIDMDTLKVNIVKFVAAVGNGDTITISEGVANPYNLFGVVAGGEKITLNAGDAYAMICNETREAVSATKKVVKILNNDGAAAATIDIIIGAGLTPP